MNSCVYAMRHKVSRHIYIGSTIDLQRRKSLWRRKMRDGDVNQLIAQVSTNYDDWEFIPIAEIPSNTLPASKARAELLERHAITQARSLYPERLLNVVDTTTRPNGTPQYLSDTIKAELVTAGVSRSTYYNRRKKGLSHEEAIAAPDRRGANVRTAIYNQVGRKISQREAAFLLQCKEATLAKRLKDMRDRNPHLKHVRIRDLIKGTKKARPGTTLPT
jgi:hypothetical protein